VEWWQASRASALTAGNDVGAAETDLNLAEVLLLQGRLSEAQAFLDHAGRVLRASGMEYYVAYVQMLRARLRLARGEHEAATPDARAAAATFTTMGNRASALEASLVLAEVATGEGRAGEALSIIHEAEQAARGEGSGLQARTHLLRARALDVLGRTDEAAAEVAAGLAAADAHGLPLERALLLQLRGELQEAEAAGAGRADLEQAAALLVALGATGGPVRASAS
jgi:ATP/maltotriose-dependent transcriptional regulator MalT